MNATAAIYWLTARIIDHCWYTRSRAGQIHYLLGVRIIVCSSRSTQYSDFRNSISSSTEYISLRILPNTQLFKYFALEQILLILSMFSQIWDVHGKETKVKSAVREITKFCTHSEKRIFLWPENRFSAIEFGWPFDRYFDNSEFIGWRSES